MRFFVALLLVLSACAGTGAQQPDWINGNSSDYPAAKYLIGEGQAEYQATARDRARADLAKVFEVSISEQSKDTVSYTSGNTGDARSAQLESSTSRNISTRTSQIISGIQIADTWRDSGTRQFHALAVLDRMKASNSLRQDISRLDDMTARAIRDTQQNPDLLSKIGQYSRAVQSQLERQAYQKHLKVVDYTGMGISSSYSIATLTSDRDALLKRVRVQTSVETDPLGGLETMLKNAASSAGFTHETAGKPDYLLTARLMLNESKDAQGWYWQRGTLEVDLARLPGKQARGSKRWNIKTSAQDKATAKARARNKIASILKQKLRRAIIGFGAP